MQSLLESGIKEVFRLMPVTSESHRPATPVGDAKGVTFLEDYKKVAPKRGYEPNSLRKSTQLQGVISPERRRYGKYKK